MRSQGSGPSQVPPGFRFHPTDEELVNYYLRKKVNMEKFDLDVITDVDLNKLEPWDLQERCRIDSSQHADWYFFSHKDKKYPTGTRTNRATTAGFWKATGRDKAVHCSFKCIGMRKTLVFYRGRAPHGIKTDWIMHEYRLENPSKLNNEDGWVVCKVFKKRIHHQNSTINHNCQIKSSQDHSTPLNASEELEQLSLVDTPNLDYCTQGENDGAGGSKRVEFACKEEVGYDEDNHGRSRGLQFLHLPQLESPKSSSSSMDQSINRSSRAFSNYDHNAANQSINSSSSSSSRDFPNYDHNAANQSINSSRDFSNCDHNAANQSINSSRDFSNCDHTAANQHSFNMGLMRRPLITSSTDQGSSFPSSSLPLSAPMDFGCDDSSFINSMYLAATPDPWSHALDSLPKDLRLYHHINTDPGLLCQNHSFPASDLPPWPLLNHASTSRASSLHHQQQPLEDPCSLDADIWSSFTRSLTS